MQRQVVGVCGRCGRGVYLKGAMRFCLGCKKPVIQCNCKNYSY